MESTHLLRGGGDLGRDGRELVRGGSHPDRFHRQRGHCLLHGRGGPVQGFGHPPDLVVAGDVDASGQVAVGDPVQDVGDLAQWTHDLSGHLQRCDQRQQEPRHDDRDDQSTGIGM
jgi:hypothetical protein